MLTGMVFLIVYTCSPSVENPKTCNMVATQYETMETCQEALSRVDPPKNALLPPFCQKQM